VPKPANFQANKNVSDIARRTGVSITTVSRKIAGGKTEADIVREADEWKAKQKRLIRTIAPAKNTETYFDAQRRKEVALANLREQELATKAAHLVPIAEVNVFVASMILRSRDILLRIAPELCDYLAQETDPIKIQKLIDAEVHRALAALSEFRK
jgi:hypothetical protein